MCDRCDCCDCRCPYCSKDGRRWWETLTPEQQVKWKPETIKMVQELLIGRAESARVMRESSAAVELMLKSGQGWG